MTYDEEIRNRFGYHPADTEGKKTQHAEVRSLILGTAVQLVEMVPAGREAALAVTKLEEAMFWATAAVARPAGYRPPRTG